MISLGALALIGSAIYAITFLHYTHAATQNYHDSVRRERLRRIQIERLTGGGSGC